MGVVLGALAPVFLLIVLGFVLGGVLLGSATLRRRTA